MVGSSLYGDGYGFTDGLRRMEAQALNIGVTERELMDHNLGILRRSHEPNPVPIAKPPPAPVAPHIPNAPVIPISKAIGGIPGDARVTELSGARSVGSGDFQTPRDSNAGKWGLSVDGYPMSPSGTVLRPPPLPNPGASAPAPNVAVLPTSSDLPPCVLNQGELSPKPNDRPEEPAKYINELPKLQSADISTSAVACGNWLAQLRQIFAGLSPTASVWWQAVELAANRHYQRWIVADPLDRLSLDPSGVVAVFDEVKYQRVESRAVSLILAAIPQHLRHEAVSNRWLSTAALLFRVAMCLSAWRGFRAFHVVKSVDTA